MRPTDSVLPSPPLHTDPRVRRPCTAWKRLAHGRPSAERGTASGALCANVRETPTCGSRKSHRGQGKALGPGLAGSLEAEAM
jgi:hypothetical protein